MIEKPILIVPLRADALVFLMLIVQLPAAGVTSLTVRPALVLVPFHTSTHTMLFAVMLLLVRVNTY